MFLSPLGERLGEGVVARESDARRTAAMEREGWRIVRFWANEVVQNPEGIWAEIEQVVGACPPLCNRMDG
ncbi:MAG: DUF559 domain-containing protein [Reyranella sp.]